MHTSILTHFLNNLKVTIKFNNRSRIHLILCSKYINKRLKVTNCINPFSPAKAPNLAVLCNPITRQVIELEHYRNHPRIQQVL